MDGDDVTYEFPAPVVGAPIPGAEFNDPPPPDLDLTPNDPAPPPPGFVRIRHDGIDEVGEIHETSLSAYEARGWQLIDEATAVSDKSKED